MGKEYEQFGCLDGFNYFGNPLCVLLFVYLAPTASLGCDANEIGWPKPNC